MEWLMGETIKEEQVPGFIFWSCLMALLVTALFLLTAG